MSRGFGLQERQYNPGSSYSSPLLLNIACVGLKYQFSGGQVHTAACLTRGTFGQKPLIGDRSTSEKAFPLFNFFLSVFVFLWTLHIISNIVFRMDDCLRFLWNIYTIINNIIVNYNLIYLSFYRSIIYVVHLVHRAWPKAFEWWSLHFCHIFFIIC